jgi:methyl coenzyme M reductase gamma subunit
MNTIQDLKNYLTEQNLDSLYTSPEKPKARMFNDFVTADGIDRQNSFARYTVQAKWWIQYNSANDTFTLRVEYFLQDGVKITKEEFVSVMGHHTPASKYNETNEYIWVKDDGEYKLQTPTIPPFIFPINTIVLK